MKKSINDVIRGVTGEPLRNENGNPLTIKDVCINSVLIPQQDDDEKKKFYKYEIFKKFRDAKDEVNLDIEEMSTLKKAIGKVQPPLVLGQCFEWLEE